MGILVQGGRTAPLGSAGAGPMNDDTDGRNKAITGVCRRRFVKEAGVGRLVLQPRPRRTGPRFPPRVLGQAASMSWKP